MQGLLTDIELDLQELRCLTEAFLREPNATMREVLKRTILQMQGRLGTMLQQLEVAKSAPIEIAKPTPLEADKPAPLTVEIPVPLEVVKPVQEAPPAVKEEIPTIVALPTDEPLIEVYSETTTILAERIRTGVDLRRSISLNDSFRFSRELFDNDSERMNRILHQIGEMSSYPAAISFLASKVKADKENEAMNNLLEQLRKYFNVSD